MIGPNNNTYTYITPDNGKTMYRGSTIEKAYQNFTSRATNTKSIFTNYSPCPQCTGFFKNKFKSGKFYVSRISENGDQEELQCMAKMYKKFPTVEMSWDVFKKQLTNKRCQDLIDNYTNLATFKDAQKTLSEQVVQIKKYSQQSNTSCTY